MILSVFQKEENVMPLKDLLAGITFICQALFKAFMLLFAVFCSQSGHFPLFLNLQQIIEMYF